MSTELVAVTRDFVIILFGVLGTACAITMTVLAVLAYRKVSRTLDAVRMAANAMESSATVVSRAAESLATGAGVGWLLTWVVTRLFGGGKKQEAT